MISNKRIQLLMCLYNPIMGLQTKSTYWKYINLSLDLHHNKTALQYDFANKWSITLSESRTITKHKNYNEAY